MWIGALSYYQILSIINKKICLQSRNLKNKIHNYTGKTNTISENYNVQSRKSLFVHFLRPIAFNLLILH